MNIGAFEIILLILVVFILFGAGKLPSVMADLGKGIKSFRKGMEAEENETPDAKDKTETEPNIGSDKNKDAGSGTDKNMTDPSNPS